MIRSRSEGATRRDWAAWAGRTQRRGRDVTRLVLGIFGLIIGANMQRGIRQAGTQLMTAVSPSVPRRIRRVLRGYPETLDGVWVDGRGIHHRVAVLLYSDRAGFGDADGEVNETLSARPLGLLDRSGRPRAVDVSGIELDRGVVLLTDSGVGSLLLRRADLAVTAGVVGWPSPSQLSHGQTVSAVEAAAAATKSTE